MQRLAPLSRSHPGPGVHIQRRPALLLPGWTASAILAAAVLLGAALRVAGLFQAGIHPDEALYATWALRIADGSDPALLRTYVDKPPFLPYLLAGIAWLGAQLAGDGARVQVVVTGGRLAAVLASLLSLALLWGIARPVYGRRVAALAVAFFALSPLAARLASSLLTDPWLVLWLLAGLWAAARGRPWLAGIACGLAYATKQQAVLLLPLVVGAFWLFHDGHGRRAAAWRLTAGLALVVVAVLWWDSLRWQWMPSYWERSADSYGGLSLIAAPQAAGHLRGWLEVTAAVLGWPLLALLALLLAGRAAVVWRDRRLRPAAPPDAAAPARRFDALLMLFCAAYLALHLVTSLAPWDRYGLPLTPVLAILLARALGWWTDRLDGQSRRPVSRLLTGAAALGLVWATLLALQPRFPVADNAAYDSVPALAGHIRSREPATAVLYHREFGWHYGLYLYGAAVELRWWQSPQELARQAAADAGRRQLLALPADSDRSALDAALRRQGLALTTVMTADHPDGSPSAALYNIEVLAGADSGG